MSNITTCESVIGVIYGHDIWYYTGEADKPGVRISKYSPALADAKRYDDDTIMDDLELIDQTLTRKILEVMRCPKCGKEFTDHPAISREDNETEICPECGVEEAVERYLQNYSEEAEEE